MQSPWLSCNLIGPKLESVWWPVADKLSWSCTLKQLITSDVIIKCAASVSADSCFCSSCVSLGRDLELFLTPHGFSVRLPSFVLSLRWTNTFVCIRTLSWFIYLSHQLLSVAAVRCGYSARFSLVGRGVVTQQASPHTHCGEILRQSCIMFVLHVVSSILSRIVTSVRKQSVLEMLLRAK